MADDGIGFEATELQPSAEHQGLDGLRERMSLVGGQLTLKSKPHQGTTLIATVPQNPANMAESVP